jgi:hypothetical protein
MESKVNKKGSKVYKSLYEVKDKYLPNASLEFLEGKNNECTSDTFMRILEKVIHPDITQPAQEK